MAVASPAPPKPSFMTQLAKAWKQFLAAPGDYIAGYLLSLLRAGLIAFLVLGSMFMDLALGPNFMTRFAVANDLQPQGTWSWVVEFVVVGVPWALSIITTAFQYLLLQARGNGMRYKTASKRVRKAIVVGWVIAIFDTATDVAGFTALVYDDPNIGKQIIPSSPHWLFGICAVIVAIICLFHERMLARTLIKIETHIQTKAEEGKRLPGTWMVEFVVTICRWLFTALSNILKGVGVPGALILDLFLSSFFVQQVFTNFSDSKALADNAAWIGLAVSGGLMAYQIMDQRAKRNETKKVAWIRDWATYVKVLDCYLDLAGFSTYMYGVSVGWTVLPDDWTPALILMLLIVGSLCLWSEYLADVFAAKPFTPLPKKPKKPGASPAAGAGGSSPQAQAAAQAAIQQRIAQQRATGGGGAPNM